MTASLLIGNTITITGAGARGAGVAIIGSGRESNTVFDNTLYYARGVCDCGRVVDAKIARANGMGVKISGSGNDRNAVLRNTLHYTGETCECSDPWEPAGREGAAPESP